MTQFCIGCNDYCGFVYYFVKLFCNRCYIGIDLPRIGLTQGLHYIHGTNLGAHGQLRSSTCLIDSRWQIKLTSFGLSYFKSGENTQAEKGDYQIYKKMLWTAPELLRLPEYERPPNGTIKGDIYSFGIVVQELIYRAMPFFMDLLSPKGNVLSQLNVQHV